MASALSGKANKSQGIQFSDQLKLHLAPVPISYQDNADALGLEGELR